MAQAPCFGMPCQIRSLEDVVAPGGFRDLPGQIALQQQAFLGTERPWGTPVIQPERVKKISC
ncbi:hypothetical protein X739_21175 [Mesorhizobium sp. LNHC220B00]|nr:hypothetical protein X739_21175 [Mesorhizobium sp. LNHC220B00]ESY90662.1 hypothetical protein X741_26165 [Mesorhizobium sp. LNHC229A00]ESY98075.1 hypothetical protein X738_18235 [Mesorhizobium sp. LNHC209A00]